MGAHALTVALSLLPSLVAGCGDREPAALAFPQGFLWGAAASAYQTEGGDPPNDWERAIRDQGRYPENGEAAGYYRLFDADHARAAGLGLGIFRVSIEWSRIEPRPGEYDEAELAHYRSVLESLRAHGLEPLVTLHHFTNPVWLADAGVWRAPQLEERFAAYARLLATRYGDLVDWWSTLNEPMVYVAGLYGLGSFPGGSINDMTKLREGFVKTSFAHAAAVDAIRAADTTDADGDGRPVRVVLIQSITPAYPLDPASEADAAAATRFDRFYNRSFLDVWIDGRLDHNFDGVLAATEPVPEGIYESLAGRADVVGITYYSRRRVQAARGVLSPVDALPCVGDVRCGDTGALAGDNGNEVYPPGLREAIDAVSGYGLPVLVVENGVADRIGTLRAHYTVMHLMQVARAIADGAGVIGYLHWSLTDNYEWAEGLEQRFGLFRVDYGTQERVLTEGGAVYSEIVRANAISADLVDRYDLPEINPLPSR